MIFFDPPYEAYYGDKLFDLSDPVLNRDQVLAPFARARSEANRRGIEVHTADLLDMSVQSDSRTQHDYYSFGLLSRYQRLAQDRRLRLKGFFVMEPPIVAPHLYQALPELTRAFESVYVHNTEGDGYSLKGVAKERLRKLIWPQTFEDVVEPYWSNRERQRRLVVVNGNHKPKSRTGELYSRRIHDMAALARFGVVDLYGRGWERWFSRNAFWTPYWLNRRVLMSIYKGPCDSKFAVLSRYSFSLCYENMVMDGYLTEKLFDCLYAGTVPVYLGSRDIGQMIAPEVFIDARKFASMAELWEYLANLSESEIERYREAGRGFLRSQQGQRYVHALSEAIFVPER